MVTKDKMKRDKILASNQCCNVYMKPEMTFMDQNFFSMVMDSELKDMTYAANFNKDIGDNTKRIVNQYHPHKDFILMSQVQSTTESEPCMFISTFAYKYNVLIHDCFTIED